MNGSSEGIAGDFSVSQQNDPVESEDGKGTGTKGSPSVRRGERNGESIRWIRLAGDWLSIGRRLRSRSEWVVGSLR